MPYVPYDGPTEEQLNTAYEPQPAPDNRSFVQRAKDDIVNTVSNWYEGAKQGFNEQIKEEKSLRGMAYVDEFGNATPRPGVDPQDVANQQALTQQAQRNFSEETIKPVALPAALIPGGIGAAAGALAIPFVAEDAQKAYNDGGIGQVARDFTYGGAVDFYNQPDLAQQFHDRPIATAANGLMSVVPPVLMGKGLYKGAKAVPELKNELIASVEAKLNPQLDELANTSPIRVTEGLDALDQVDSPTRGFRPATPDEMTQWNADQQLKAYGQVFDQQPQARFNADTQLADLPKMNQGEAVSPLLSTLEGIKQSKWDTATGDSWQNHLNVAADDAMQSPAERIMSGAEVAEKKPFSSGQGIILGEQAQPKEIYVPDQFKRQAEPQAAIRQPFKLPTAEDLVSDTEKRYLDSQLQKAVNSKNYDAVNRISSQMQQLGHETPLSRAVLNKNIEFSKTQKPLSDNAGGFVDKNTKFQPDNLKAEMINGISTKIEQPKVNAFVDNALSERPQFRTMALRETTPHEVARIKALTDIDTTGYRHEIDTNNLRHALNQHGNPAKEAATRQVAITPEDLKRIPEILNSPDNIKRGSDSGPHKSLIYEKRENGSTYYVETVMPSRGVLRSKTMWKKLSSADRAVSDPPYTSSSDGLHPTNPERSIASSVDNNIQQPGEIYKGKEFSYSPNAGTENMAADLLNRAYSALQQKDYDTALNYAKQTGSKDIEQLFRQIRDTEGGAVPLKPRFEGKPEGEYSGQNITMRQLLQRAGNLFVPNRTGRIGQRDVEGFMNHNTGIIRVRSYGDLNTLSHEVGHSVDAALGLRKYAGAFDNEFTKAVHERFGEGTYEPEQVRAEGIAEFMKDYVNNPERAQQTFPRYYSAFEDALSKNPDVQARVNEFKDMVSTWQEQSPEARGRSGVSYSYEQKPELVQRGKDAWLKTQEYWLDDKVGLARVTSEYERITSEKLATTDDPYKMARLAQNAAVARADLLIDGKNAEHVKDVLNESYGGAVDSAVTMRTVLQHLDGLSKKYPEYLKQGNFKDWHEALDTLLVARRQIELQSIHPEYKGSMPQGDALRIINNAPKELQDAAQEFYKFNNNILRILAHEGMIKPEVYEALTTKYKNYAPMARDFSDESAIEKGFGMGTGYGNVRNPLKAISEEGSTRQVISPLESTVKNTYAMLNLVERNNVGKIFTRLAEGDRVGKLVEEVSGTASQKDSVFSVLVNGEKHYYQTTPDIYRAIMSINKDSANAITKLLSPPASLLRAGATLTPDFAFKNIIRDTFSAAVFSRYGFIPVVDHAAGIFHMLKKDKLFYEYKASGALQSTLVGLDRDYTQASIRGLYKNGARQLWNNYNPVQLLRGFSEALETATRLGEYSKARSKGVSVADAALSARDITLDFSKHGVYGKTANKIVAFFNAAVQEPARIAQAFKENPKATAAKIGLYITTPSVVLWAMNHDQDWYKELPSYQKNLFWVFKAGDTVYRIPKPFGLGVLFGSGTERMLDWAYSQDSKGMSKWAGDFLSSMAPNILPTAIAPILEWQANYSFFTDRNIVPQREEKLPNKMQFGPDTSELAKYIGEKFDLSPRKVDALMQGYGAGMARQSLNIADAVQGARPYNNPYSSAFTVDPYKSPQSIQDFYEELNKAEQSYNASKLNKTSFTGTDKNNYAKLTGANKMMQQLNKLERETLQSSKIDADQKAAKVADINKKQAQLAQAALKQIKR